MVFGIKHKTLKHIKVCDYGIADLQKALAVTLPEGYVCGRLVYDLRNASFTAAAMKYMASRQQLRIQSFNLGKRSICSAIWGQRRNMDEES